MSEPMTRTFAITETPRTKPRHGRPRKSRGSMKKRPRRAPGRAPNPAAKCVCAKCKQYEKSAIPNVKHRGCGGEWRTGEPSDEWPGDPTPSTPAGGSEESR